MTDPKPCPFCGNEPSSEYIHGDLHYSCGCIGYAWIHEDIWNNRCEPKRMCGNCKLYKDEVCIKFNENVGPCDQSCKFWTGCE